MNAHMRNERRAAQSRTGSRLHLVQASDLGCSARPAHRLALFCALLHLVVCGAVAATTETWGLWASVGVPAVLFNLWLAHAYPETLAARLGMAAGFMALTGLIIQQTGGDMEANFSFSIMLSVLVVYCDWRPLVFAYLLVMGGHFVVHMLHPLDLGGAGWDHQQGSLGRFLVHGTVGAAQVVALCYLAIVLRGRLALEVENAALGRSVRSLNDEVNRDPLTGLYNRRYLDARVRDIRSLVSYGRETVAVCVIDIDHFKRVNDTYGHAAGDAVLKAVSAKLACNIRQGDLAVRQGGEEFVILLRQCDLEPAAERADEIRRALEAMQIDLGGATMSVTASFGLAVWSGTDGFEDVLYLADQALYQAKQRGRNCVQIGYEADRPAVRATLAPAAGAADGLLGLNGLIAAV